MYALSCFKIHVSPILLYLDTYTRPLHDACPIFHSLPWVQPGNGANVVRAAYSYMQSQVEAGHGCPLTMTFASVPTLKLTPSVAEQWLPKVLNNDYEPDNKPWYEKSSLTIGMGMTEKQGGSDVRANTSVARARGARGPGELYEVTGHKWFLSAPMCDGFLMLAQAEGGLSCFLGHGRGSWRDRGFWGVVTARGRGIMKRNGHNT